MIKMVYGVPVVVTPEDGSFVPEMKDIERALSPYTKAIIINEDREIVGRSLIDTGANVVLAAENAYSEALKNSDIHEEEVEYIIGTGYGRYRVTFGNTQVTEISCHARGASHMFPNTKTVLDMGGQWTLDRADDVIAARRHIEHDWQSEEDRGLSPPPPPEP